MNKQKIILSGVIIFLVIIFSGCNFTKNIKNYFQKPVNNNQLNISQNEQPASADTGIFPTGSEESKTICDGVYPELNIDDPTKLEKVEAVWDGKATKLSDVEVNTILYKVYPNYKKIADWVETPKKICDENRDSALCVAQKSKIILYKVGTVKGLGYSIYFIAAPSLYSQDMMGGARFPMLGYYNPGTNQMINLNLSPEWLDYDFKYGLDYQELSSLVSTSTLPNDVAYCAFQLFSGVKVLNLSEEFKNKDKAIILPERDKGSVLEPIGFYKHSVAGVSNLYNLGDFGIDEPDTGKMYGEKFSNLPDYLNNKLVSGLKFDNGCFYRIFSNGSIYAYSLEPYFFKQKDNPADKEMYPDSFSVNIDWKNKNNAEDAYLIYKKTGQCGFVNPNCGEIIREKWLNENNLVEIGKTTLGEKVYEPKDKKTNEFYKNFFAENNVWGVFGKEENGSLSEAELYQKFIDDQPFFFWKDSWGNWRVYQKAKYQPMAECGKPVIYLYPEKEMDVNVKVKPNGGFTITDPLYPETGWQVRATPQSELLNYSNSQKYPYLFWEGKARGLQVPNEGFVLKRSQIKEKMTMILARLGLNEKETADFLEFWQPKLENSPYVLVRFVTQENFDKVAPLNVFPKPDKIIRVFMDYMPLEQPIVIKAPTIFTPQRTGFTVVEWGGRLHE